MTAFTRVYKTADGRDFPVEWPSEEDARLKWSWDPEHNPVAAKPLDQAAWIDYRRAAKRARIEAGFPEADPFGRALWFHGFGYYAELPPDPEVSAGIERASAALLERFGGPLQTWEGWCLPRIRASCAALRESSPEARAHDLIDHFGYGYEQTFLWFFVKGRNDLTAFVNRELGEGNDLLLSELMQGYPTATLEADQALWELAQVAAADAMVRKALSKPLSPGEAGKPRPRGEGEAARGEGEAARGEGEAARGEGEAARGEGEALEAFHRALEDFLDVYGWRTEDWDPSTPTWRDHPDRVLALVRRTIEEKGEAPAEAVGRAAARREEAARQVEGRLESPDKREEFRRLNAAAAAYVTIKEGRAHWQLTLNGHLGAAFRRLGARLVREGRIAEGEDVFCLTPEEIDAGEGGGRLQRVVEERRLERERWLGVVPPRSIGGEGAAAEIQAESPAAPAGELKGVGASRGRVTAVARVLAEVADGARLQPGEVLVCATTTPTWTPLFAVAGAIVTDGGGMLSHPAIAAREYGIAAVVGTKTATSVIRDGVVVTVDGEAGTVEIEGGL